MKNVYKRTNQRITFFQNKRKLGFTTSILYYFIASATTTVTRIGSGRFCNANVVISAITFSSLHVSVSPFVLLPLSSTLRGFHGISQQSKLNLKSIPFLFPNHNNSNTIMPTTRSGKTSSSIDMDMNNNDNNHDDSNQQKEIKRRATSKRNTKKAAATATTTTTEASKAKSKSSTSSKKTTKSSGRKRNMSTQSTDTKTKENPPKSPVPSTPPSSNTKKPKKTPPSSTRRKRQRIEPGSLSPPDPNWESIYTLVQELRKDKTAPMDYDGGHALPERHRGDKVYRYQVLTALMLSSQTKDAVVGDAMRQLQAYGLDVERIRDIEKEKLSQMIGKVGFYNNKTKFMMETAKILIEEYDGDIPPDANEMMKLPGVGPKMAYIIESIVYNKASGIGVDTHMHRMFNDLKWVNSKTPEQTREQLEGWLPKDKWGELNGLFVGFGQESQQQKEKIIKKALICSRPKDALNLLKRVGVDLKKESVKYGLEEEVNDVLNSGKKKKRMKEVKKEDDTKETKE